MTIALAHDRGSMQQTAAFLTLFRFATTTVQADINTQEVLHYDTINSWTQIIQLGH